MPPRASRSRSADEPAFAVPSSVGPDDRQGPFRLRCAGTRVGAVLEPSVCDVIADNVETLDGVAMARQAHNAVTGHNEFRQVTLDEDGNEIRPGG